MHRPWTARHASRIPNVGASAEASVGTATSALASTSVFLRPQRSDSGPQTHAPAARTRMTIETVRPAAAALTSKSRESSGRIACVEYMTANIPAAPRRKPASAARVWPVSSMVTQVGLPLHPPRGTTPPHMSSTTHEHDHAHAREHGHSHGLVDPSIKRSREGVRAVAIALAVLGATTVAQAVVFVASGSVALLADLIHNGGDALTAVPLGPAFLPRSPPAELFAGLAVVAAIFVSACVAGAEAVHRLIDPSRPDHLVALAAAGAIRFARQRLPRGARAAAGAIGCAGNWLAAGVRTRAGRRLESPALIADGDHALADAYVSLGVVASAAVVALGLDLADPLIGLVISLLILRITWHSWRTVRG